jgi:hypothetical protein
MLLDPCQDRKNLGLPRGNWREQRAADQGFTLQGDRIELQSALEKEQERQFLQPPK